MPQAIRIWEVGDDNTIKEVTRPKIAREQQLEEWLENDISMLSSDLLVIGRQLQTDFGGYIDLFCLDSRGDPVIIELKRGRTPREVTAQSLDYASWVKTLSNDRITEIADRYLGTRGPLEDAFFGKFGEGLPDTLNENHRVLIVAEEMDDSTERIVRYLSDAGIGINIATVQHFKTSDGQEMLAQVFLIEPTGEVTKAQAASKRRPPLTYDQLQAIAEEKGVGPTYACLLNGLEGVFDQRGTTVSSVGFRGKLGEGIKVIFSLLPGSSDAERGLHFQLYGHRLGSYLHMDHEQVSALLPANHEPWTYWPMAPKAEAEEWSGYRGYFIDENEAQLFVKHIKDKRA